MDKEDVAHIYNGILLSHKKKRNGVTYGHFLTWLTRIFKIAYVAPILFLSDSATVETPRRRHGGSFQTCGAPLYGRNINLPHTEPKIRTRTS